MRLIPISIITLLAGISVYTLVPFAIRWARKVNWLDVPGGRKMHLSATPSIGGLAIYCVWFLSLLVYALVRPAWWTAVHEGMLPLLAAISILVVGGAIDDRKKISPRAKLVLQMVASAIVISFHSGVRLAIDRFAHDIGALAWPLAFFWMVGMSNAINLIDGLDGLATTISAGILVSLVSLGVITSNSVEFQVGGGLLAATLIGFLPHNLPNAKAFLGDAGSLPTGFAIGVFVLESTTTAPWASERFVILALLAGYPILDTMLVVYHRLKNGLPVFTGDQNHIHHRLVRLGLEKEGALAVILSLSFFIQLHAVVVNELLQDWSIRSNTNHLAALVLTVVMLAVSLCVAFLLLRRFEKRERAKAKELANVILFPIVDNSTKTLEAKIEEIAAVAGGSGVRDSRAMGSEKDHISSGSA